MKIDLMKWDWLSVVCGIALFAIAGQLGSMRIDFYLHSTVTVGEVVKLNHGGYHPQVTFTASDGQRLSFAGSSTYPVEAGDRLEVRYRRDRPVGTAVLNQFQNIFDFALIPAIVGLVFVVMGMMGKSMFRLRHLEDQSDEGGSR